MYISDLIAIMIKFVSFWHVFGVCFVYCITYASSVYLGRIPSAILIISMISFCPLSVVIYLSSIWNQYNSKSQNNMSTHLTIKNRPNRETRRPRNLSASWGYDLFCVRKQGLSWGRKLSKQQSVKQTSCLDVWTCFFWRRVWCIWKKNLNLNLKCIISSPYLHDISSKAGNRGCTWSRPCQKNVEWMGAPSPVIKSSSFWNKVTALVWNSILHVMLP